MIVRMDRLGLSRGPEQFCNLVLALRLCLLRKGKVPSVRLGFSGKCVLKILPGFRHRCNPP